MPRKLVNNPATEASPAAKAARQLLHEQAVRETSAALSQELGRTEATQCTVVQPEIPPEHVTLIEHIFADRPNIVKELHELEAALGFGDLHPEAIRAELAKCERRALQAHRLEMVIKRDRERFKIEAEAAVGTMRESAFAQLEEEKLKGKRNKAITNDDVRDRAVTIHRDEWREVQDKIETFERYSKHAERLADLWQQRARTLIAMLGGR